MRHQTLTRYLISEILPPFFFGLLVFTFVLLIARILRLIELVITRGVPLIQTAKLFSLILPTFLELTVPMAFLLAILLGLGRLSSDQELLAMKASGVSPRQILWPLGLIALIIAIVTWVLTLMARPAANLALKKELYNIAKNRVGTALKEKVFNDDFPNILIYVEEIIPPGSTAQGVLIVDKRNRVRDVIILGKVALISTDEETNTLGLKLFDGSIYETERDRPGFSQTRFHIYDFKLGLDELISPAKMKDAGPKEMSLGHLLGVIQEKANQEEKAIPERMELHQRISFGFAPFVFCLLGVSLALLPRSSRANRSWGFMLCFFWLLTYYTFLSLGKALGDKGILDPIAALWLPNLVLGGVAIHFFRKACRESPLRFEAGVETALSSARQHFTRLRRKHRLSA
ncbi:MAG TPA: LPS export ABC transporter permease LptF [Candidatus Binatia bacterium]|nr:LPS export ABC transporter permease LptF [Candidatus Binatia bacterium]